MTRPPLVAVHLLQGQEVGVDLAHRVGEPIDVEAGVGRAATQEVERRDAHLATLGHAGAGVWRDDAHHYVNRHLRRGLTAALLPARRATTVAG